MSVTTHTTCPYCGVGCGVAATVDNGGVSVTGDTQHPANHGRLCSKGAALAGTVGLHGRLLHPRVDGARASWDTALDTVADGFARIIAEHGPGAVAFYVSGQLLTEDYYVANKLMKGYIGSANIDTNSRLCMSSAVSGHQRAFGEDVVPGCYEDMETADLVVLVGSNTAWCHPIVYQRIVAARENQPNKRLVVIDPRRTATAQNADLHLAPAPGTDVALFNGLLVCLAAQGQTRDLPGADAAVEAARAAGDVGAVAQTCGVDADDLATFFDWFAATDKTVTLFSQGVNQSSAGTDKVNAITNCHLLTGRIGKPGACPFSITGQPNAMGGREVGGLSSTLAAHMGFEQAETVQRFWDAPAIAGEPGLKAVDLFDAIESGRIKAVWIMATNPLVSLPDADRVQRALQRCELLVASDCMRHTDTLDVADVLLPAATWGEKNGTVSNSERVISRQRGFLPLPGEAQPDWWIICEVARRMGFGAGFDYDGPAAIFREHARLTAFENNGERVLNLEALAELDGAAYDRLAPVRWPATFGDSDNARLFADGVYPTEDGQARMVALTPRAPATPPDARWPLVLNTGRVRDHWHTMTRTALSARLSAHTPEPFVEIHPDDARRYKISGGGLVRVTSPRGTVIARAVVTADQRCGALFVPMHWNRQFAARARVGALIDAAACPVSGQPESKHTPVAVESFVAAWHGFILSERALPLSRVAGIDYWVKVPGERFFRYEIAGAQSPENWAATARAWLGVGDRDADWIEAADAAAGIYRAAHFDAGTLEACVFVAPEPPRLPERAWLSTLFTQQPLDEPDRASVLAGRPADPAADTGPQICACFGVGRNTICAAMREHDLASVQAVGEMLEAGTNCGSCKPDIQALIESQRAELETRDA